MVGDGIKGLDGQAPGEAAQALTAILQTHYLRYLIIVSWAVGVIATVGLVPGLLWFRRHPWPPALCAARLKSASANRSAPGGAWSSLPWPLSRRRSGPWRR